jgi:hypothetical protein
VTLLPDSLRSRALHWRSETQRYCRPPRLQLAVAATRGIGRYRSELRKRCGRAASGRRGMRGENHTDGRVHQILPRFAPSDLSLPSVCEDGARSVCDSPGLLQWLLQGTLCSAPDQNDSNRSR